MQLNIHGGQIIGRDDNPTVLYFICISKIRIHILNKDKAPGQMHDLDSKAKSNTNTARCMLRSSVFDVADTHDVHFVDSHVCTLAAGQLLTSGFIFSVSLYT